MGKIQYNVMDNSVVIVGEGSKRVLNDNGKYNKN